MKKIPLIIDCDPGLDDAFAIMIANASELYDIKALTTVGGNVKLEYTTRNALNLAHLYGIDTIVAKGSEGPMLIPLEDASYVHGSTGLGTMTLGESPQALDGRHAWDVIYDEAIKAEGELEIAAIGPLTNIAIFLKKYGYAKKYIKRLIIMGGSNDYGNTDPYGEFNIWVDPLAADIVFKSEIPILMVGLSAIKTATLTFDQVEEVINMDCRGAKIAGGLFDSNLKRKEKLIAEGKDPNAARPWICDGMTLACTVDPTMVHTEKYHVAIETGNTLTRGRTIIDWNGTMGKSFNADVAISVDREKFFKVIKDSVSYYK